MRRRILSVLVLVLALVGVVVGVAMAVLLGPDNRLTTGPHDVGTDHVALVTSPEVLRWAGPTVTVTAELPDNQPVFLGLGNTVDVADFLSRTGFERVDTLDLPWRVSTTTVSGKRYVPAAPMAADWWIAQNAGQGGAQITVPLPDETTSLVVVALAGDLQDLQVSGSYFLAGGFGAGLGLAALALGVGMFGWLALRTVGAPAAAPRTAAPRRRPAGSAPARRPAGTAPRPRPAGGKPSRPGPPRPAGSAPPRPRALRPPADPTADGSRVRVPRPRPAGGETPARSRPSGASEASQRTPPPRHVDDRRGEGP